jgi:hypothetical protein
VPTDPAIQRRLFNVEDLKFDTARRLKLTIRKSKTDQQH